MNACNVCFHWALPLAMRAQQDAYGAVVAMRFEEWMMYHLHVVMHQAGHWSGDFPLDQTLSQAL